MRHTYCLKALIFFLFGILVSIYSADESKGVNLTIDEGYGARYTALSYTSIGLTGDGTSIDNFPAALDDAEELWMTVSHSKRFSSATYDDISIVIPFDSTSTLGFGFSRFAVGENELYRQESVNFGSEPYDVITTSDYLLIGAIARSWKGLQVGGNLSLLYRKLDQKGVGVRGDLSTRYIFQSGILLGLLIKGALPSSARWESSVFEYESPDLYMGAGYETSSNYFYGTFRIAVETPGMFQAQSKSQRGLTGGRISDSPMDILKTSKTAAEYQLNLGLVFRIGIPELAMLATDFRPSMGIGYKLGDKCKVDYSFVPHDALQSAHRISMSASPAIFGKKISRPGTRISKIGYKKMEDTYEKKFDSDIDSTEEAEPEEVLEVLEE